MFAPYLLPAHLMIAGWHMAALLLYGAAGVGMILGIGLFLWGRLERQREPVLSDQDHRDEANVTSRLMR
ncbi:MAG: hypothetical protein U0031_22025 [Thermomicrobiales bacterium]